MINFKSKRGKMKLAKKKARLLIVVLFVLLIFVLIRDIDADIFNKKSKDKFELGTLFLKIVMNENGMVSSSIKIKNLDSENLHIYLKLVNMANIASLNNYEVDLDSGEEKDIKINLNAKNFSPGVYLGNLEVYSDKESKKIPIIIEIQSKEVLFDSDINFYPQGDIVLGQGLNTEIKIFDLTNIGRSKINLNYFINDFNNRTIISGSEDLIVENRLDYSKSLEATKNMGLGDYAFITIIRYSNSVGTSSLYFKIVDKKEQLGKNIFWIIFIIIFFFFLFFSIFFYFLFYRDRVLVELKSQYKREIQKQEEFIKNQEKKYYSKLKTNAEKREIRKQIKKIKKQRISYVKKIHERRVEYYKKIRKKGDKKLLENQLKKWKQQGYNTAVLEERFKFPSAKEIKRKIEKWKFAGYDTSVLETKPLVL